MQMLTYNMEIFLAFYISAIFLLNYAYLKWGIKALKFLFNLTGFLNKLNCFSLSVLLTYYFSCLNAYIARILKQIQVLYYMP